MDIPTTLAAAIKATIGIALIGGLSIAVQSAWRRVFPDGAPDDDVLATRIGCGGCPKQVACHPSECEGDNPDPISKPETT